MHVDYGMEKRSHRLNLEQMSKRRVKRVVNDLTLMRQRKHTRARASISAWIHANVWKSIFSVSSVRVNWSGRFNRLT